MKGEVDSRVTSMPLHDRVAPFQMEKGENTNASRNIVSVSTNRIIPYFIQWWNLTVQKVFLGAFYLFPVLCLIILCMNISKT